MRKIFLIVCLLALSACASQPQTVGASATGRGGVVGFATLAEFGSWEYQLAPAYTRLAVLRHQAANALTAKRISVDVAVAVQATADEARSLLDASRRGNAKTPTDEQHLMYAEALAKIGVIETLLENKP